MSDSRSGRSYAGTPESERVAVRRRQLIAAAGELAGEGGRLAVTVRAVCQLAGLNQRYFYESYATVDELLADCFDAFVKRAICALTAPIQAKRLSLRDGTVLILERLVPLFEMAGPESQNAICVALGSDAFAARRTQVLDEAVEIVAVGIEELPGRGDGGLPANRIAARVLVTGVTEALVAWGTRRLDASRAEMILCCSDIVVAAVGMTSAASRTLAEFSVR